MPGSTANGKLHGIELGVPRAGNLRDARKSRKLGIKRPRRLEAGIRSDTRWRLIDIFCNDELAALASHVARLKHNFRSELMLHIQAEVLHVGGRELLIDSIHAEGRLRSDTAKDGLIFDHCEGTGIVLYAKNWVWPARIP